MNSLQKAIELNREGNKHFFNGEWERAVLRYNEALDCRPDYVDAYYNLGLAYKKCGNIASAYTAFYALLTLFPEHVGALYQMGCYWMLKEQYNPASTYFEKALMLGIDSIESQINLGTCYLKLNRLDDATKQYLDVLKVMPNECQVLFNLAVIHTKQHAIQQAMICYFNILKINPAHYATHHNLGALYLTLKDYDRARHHFRIALQIENDHPEVHHMLQMLSDHTQCQPVPDRYLKLLFNDYADHYDEHVNALSYQVPQLLYEMVKQSFSGTRFDRVLDLGCGTGLCGLLFRSIAQHLHGVDLSSAMLTIARERHLYDALFEGEILHFLTTTKEAYDLIVAGDVLVYFHDLTAIFAALKQILKPNGLFVFNIEQGEGRDCMMQSSGRYQHTFGLIETLCETYCFSVLQSQRATLRLSSHQPVSGHCTLLQLQST